MKTNTFLVLFFLVFSNVLLGQIAQASASIDTYAPNYFNDGFSAEESWKIHKAAYVKQLKSKGLSDEEIKKSLLTYEKDKAEFIAQVKEQRRLAEIHRKEATKLRAQAEIQRQKATEQRRLAEIQRQKADELRGIADEQRKKAEEQSGENSALREQADELRKQADELRKQADILSVEADNQRKIAQEWRKNSKTILTENVTLTKQSKNNKPITFNVDSKTTLHIGIRAHLGSGTTLIEIYNPKGIKEGELSLDLKSTSVSNKGKEVKKETSGSIDKTISSAEVGEWQIKISSQKAEGSVAISVAQTK